MKLSEMKNYGRDLGAKAAAFMQTYAPTSMEAAKFTGLFGLATGTLTGCIAGCDGVSQDWVTYGSGGRDGVVLLCDTVRDHEFGGYVRECTVLRSRMAWTLPAGIAGGGALGLVTLALGSMVEIPLRYRASKKN